MDPTTFLVQHTGCYSHAQQTISAVKKNVDEATANDPALICQDMMILHRATRAWRHGPVIECHAKLHHSDPLVLILVCFSSGRRVGTWTEEAEMLVGVASDSACL